MLESEIDKQKAGLKNLHIQIQDLRSKLDHKNADEDGQSGRKLIARYKLWYCLYRAEMFLV